MTTTPYFSITHIEQSQSQKEVTANEAFDKLAEAIAEYTIRTETDQAWTLAASDIASIILADFSGSPSDITVTVPDSSVAWPKGAHVTIVQWGTGQVVLSAQSGSPTVTIRTPQTLRTRGQYSTISLVKTGVDEWLVMGDLEAA